MLYSSEGGVRGTLCSSTSKYKSVRGETLLAGSIDFTNESLFMLHSSGLLPTPDVTLRQLATKKNKFAYSNQQIIIISTNTTHIFEKSLGNLIAAEYFA